MSSSNKLILNDWNWRTPITDILNIEENNISPTRRIVYEGTSASRYPDTKYTRDGRNEESSRELRVDEFSVQKLRESHETIQRLTSHMQEMQEQLNSMSDSGDKMWNRITVGDFITFSVNQQRFLTHGVRLDRRKTFWVINCSTVDSSRNHYQGIYHHRTPGVTGSIPVHIGTGTPVARDEERNRGTIPMPTFARRPSTISSFFPVDIPQNSMVGQQRQQISELQFDKFLHIPHFHVGR